MATNSGQHYEDGEIALIYLVKRSDKGKTALAKILGRTPGGIDMVWRWMEHANFPPSAENKIKRQFAIVQKALGVRKQGSVEL